MQESDKRPMHEAISQATQCRPVKDSIPKVGAVIAVEGNIIATGRRGTGAHR